jgi:hypothetical protein
MRKGLVGTGTAATASAPITFRRGADRPPHQPDAVQTGADRGGRIHDVSAAFAVPEQRQELKQPTGHWAVNSTAAENGKRQPV